MAVWLLEHVGWLGFASKVWRAQQWYFRGPGCKFSDANVYIQDL